MATDIRGERLRRRIAELSATDPQFAAAIPSETVAAALGQPGLRLPQIVQTALDGYADRPAVGQRAFEFVTEPVTRRTSVRLLPHFDTITYRQLSDRIGGLARAWAADGMSPCDRVCIFGFTSVDYLTIDVALGQIGAVSVPLQTSAALRQLLPIVTETQPSLIASSVSQLPDAVELILTGHSAAMLVVFDYQPEVDDQRDALEAARTRLADTGVIVETLDDILARGKFLPAADVEVPGEDDPLALLIYTSGSTGAPKGAMYRESAVAKMWRRSTRDLVGAGAASITLNFMPMSHAMARYVVYATLGNGGTAYFVAMSDLSTLLEDLTLVRPTELNFVPRIWEMLYGEYQRQVDRRLAGSTDPVERGEVEAVVLAEQRQCLLGGRFVLAMTGSAPTSPELKVWVEALLEMHLLDGYASTEAGMVMFDNEVRRPPVIDYKLVDVPDLGYFSTDRPHSRGELLLRTENMFPGYYKRAEATANVFDEDGYYRTGDVFAEIAPNRL
ncbi:AMP-binding protein, partial [Mycobacterium colombiense]|uniref:AMP-binding protein n=1 Tax=Mycobacterium colombiense TaxID=339268 RepID=UPI000A98A264